MQKYKSIKILYSIDKSKYGTGGAIKKASVMANTKDILIINGDTYFDIKISDLVKEHYRSNNHITIALKPMINFDRYGYVERNNDGRIISFAEKNFCKKGFIDGGVYLIKKSIFSDSLLGKNFSFNNFMVKNIHTLKIGSKVFDNFFWRIVMKKRTVNQIGAKYTKRFLLLSCSIFFKPCMDYNFIVIFVRINLKSYPNPTMTIVFFCKINSSHCVGITKKHFF